MHRLYLFLSREEPGLWIRIRLPFPFWIRIQKGKFEEEKNTYNARKLVILLHQALQITKCNFLTKLLKLDPDPHLKKQLDPDPQKKHVDPQPWVSADYIELPNRAKICGF